jgi:hypothetical protein
MALEGVSEEVHVKRLQLLSLIGLPHVLYKVYDYLFLDFEFMFKDGAEKVDWDET